MLYYLTSLFLILPQPTLCKSAAKLCHGSATLADDGNWYCREVKAITYQNLNQPGKYNRTTGISPDTGLCQHEPIAYSGVGPTTPLIGELSMHLRGPMNVSQMAVYKLPDASSNSVKSQPRRRSNYRKYLDRKRHESQHGRSELAVDSISIKGNQKRLCPQSTITTTLYVRGSTCGATYTPSSTTWGVTSSFMPSLPPVPGSVIPSIPELPPPINPPLSPDPAVPSASAFPPPPVVLPSPAIPPPAVTTAVHDTTTVCSKTTLINDTSVSVTLGSSSLLIPDTSPPLPPAIPTTSNQSFIASSTCETDTESEGMHTMHRPIERGAGQNPSTAIESHIPSSYDNDIDKAAGGAWNRVAYYTSKAPSEATGFAFTANLGDPQKSGTFDYAFGNSLGYVIGDGSKVTTDSTPFDGTLQTSEREIAVFSDEICDGECEYARPNAVAHHGWGGPSKAFLIEFQMDHYDNEGSDQGMLSDAPAWWFLNAAIPRMLQYGNDRNNIPCSCWSTGCGEFDAFELLGRGEMRAKSTIHRQGNREGGDSNYFLRPVGRTLKFATIFHNWNITATVLDDAFDFSQSLTQAQIDDLLAYDEDDDSHSLFPIGD